MFTFFPPETVLLGWVFLYEKKMMLSFCSEYGKLFYREDISLLYNTNDDNRIYHIWNIHGTSRTKIISICKIAKGGKLKMAKKKKNTEYMDLLQLIMTSELPAKKQTQMINALRQLERKHRQDVDKKAKELMYEDFDKKLFG